MIFPRASLKMLKTICSMSVMLLVFCQTGGLGNHAAQAGLGHFQPAANPAMVELQSRHVELNQTFEQQLSQLILDAGQAGLTDLVTRLAILREGHLRHETTYLKPTRQVGEEIPISLPENERAIRMRFQTLQAEYSQALFHLSQRAIDVSLPSLSYQILLEILHVCPDHEQTRRILGYVRYGNEWVTPFERDKRQKKYVDDPQLGWILQRDVEKYEQGLRSYDGRWIQKDREAEYRRDFRHAWQIRTANFLVKTNHSLEKGVQIARELEDFHQYFRFLFAGFYNSHDQMKALFKSNTSPLGRTSQLYEVHYYAQKSEYVAQLIEKVPQIAVTNGLYMNDDGIAYFFDDPGNSSLTALYHEATHQLFYQSQSKDRAPGQKSNFWIIEGIACYMESFQKSEDGLSMTTGHPEYIRFINARQNLLLFHNYVPFQQFSSMGQNEFQSGAAEDLQHRYSQATGLTHYFMLANEGAYRDALIFHLGQLYSSSRIISQSPESLLKLTGQSFDDLDRDYRHYCIQVDQQIALNASTEQ